MDNVVPITKNSKAKTNSSRIDDPVLFKIPIYQCPSYLTPTYEGNALLGEKMVFYCDSDEEGSDCIIDLNKRVLYPVDDVIILSGNPAELPHISWDQVVEIWVKEDRPERKQ